MTSAAYEVGLELPPLEVGEISKEQIAEYSRVSHDPNPMHTDEELARSAGYPGVFAQGMLGMAFLTRYLTEVAGVGTLRGIKVRFQTMTWPGEWITCRATVTQLEDGEKGPRVTCDIRTENQDGEPKVVGTATFETSQEPRVPAKPKQVAGAPSKAVQPKQKPAQPEEKAMSKIESAGEWFDRVLPEEFDPSKVGGFSGTFCFRIRGELGGEWSVTIDGDDLNIETGLSADPVFTVNMKDENFMSLMNGEINGQQAFMSGKLKFKGNMSKAMKLQELLF